MTRKRIIDWQYLDAEKLFKYYWQDMGNGRSILKLRKWCGVNGIINPKTSKLPTAMGLWFSIWRWALKPENQKKAYEIYNKAMMDRGVFLNDAQWKDVLKNKAETCLNKKYYQRFLNDNGFAS